MQKEKVLVPELRYPEFEGDWESKEFKEVVKINQGLQIAIADRLLEPKNGALFYITNEFLNPKSDKRFYIENATNSVICDEDDILMTRTGNTGKVVTNVSGAFHNNFFRIAYPTTIKKEYLYNFLILPKTQNFIQRLAGTSTIPDLNHSDFYKIKFNYPPLKEQQKIANFLTSIDTQIQTLEKKKSLLEQYKKGVMQKRSKQELRAKEEDGKAFPEWEEKMLGEVFEEIKNKVGKQNIETYSISAGKGFISQKEKFGKDISGKQNEKYIIVEENQFSYNKGNSKTYKYGCIYLNRTGENIAVPNVFISFKKRLNNINEGFYEHYFIGHNLDRDLRKMISSSARMDGLLNISKQNFFNIIIPMPSLKEQIKIANFLSAIDKNITLVNTKIEHTKSYKKGLLQQMFV